MKTLVVYDSVSGNTEKIAQAMGGALGAEVEVIRVSEANPPILEKIDLLMVGSPTHGGRPTPAVQSFLNKIPENGLQGIRVAAFDTRLTTRWVVMFGYAAGRIANNLKRKGGNLVIPPAGFFVQKNQGPLKDGELKRAAAWAKTLVK